MSTQSPHLHAGQLALGRADWGAAKGHFQSALDEQASPEAHDGLGLALWWLNEIAAAHHHRTQAYLGYKQAGNLRRAVWLAAWLAREQVFLRANVSAMNGWFARADRLVREVGCCAELGWLHLYRASMTATPPELAQIAQQVIELAREFGDVDLEMLALANAGMAQVAQGRVRAGMAYIDEAMAAATNGEVHDIFTVCEIFCVALSTCELAWDWVRTDQWCRAVGDYAERHSSPFLSAYCRTTYGGLLAATGRWHDAEQVLIEAIRIFDAGHQALRIHAVLKLADLRVSQGRLEEAEVLLSGYEDYGNAILPRARLHLAQNEPALARAVLAQALHTAPSSSLHRAPLLRLLVDVCLAQEDVDAARAACDELAAQAQSVGGDLLLAEAELARGQIKRFLGEADADHCFLAALDRLKTFEQSLLAARARLGMARVLMVTDPAGAIAWGRAAHASFERIGALRDANEAATLLRELGVAGKIGARQPALLSPREEEVLALLAHGLTNRQIAARLIISEKTAEHHVGSILAKLGLRSRAEAAAYAVKRE